LFAASIIIATVSYAQEITRKQEIDPTQQTEKVQPAGKLRSAFLAIPGGVAHEVESAARDLTTFRDRQWSILTIGQIGAGIADAKTSLDSLNGCATCREVGPSRFLIGARPDAHKYIVGGLIEIGVEAVTAHYMLNRGPAQKWYWRVLWTLPQSLSLYEHAQAASNNAGLNLSCDPTGLHC